MKRTMTVSALLLLSFLCLSGTLRAQNPAYDLRFVQRANGGAYLDVTVQIRSAGADFALFDGNLVWTFSGNITAPKLLKAINFSGEAGYRPMTLTQPVYGRLSLNLVQYTPPYVTVSREWLDVALIRFSVTNPFGRYTLAWLPRFTHVYQKYGGPLNHLPQGGLLGLTGGMAPLEVSFFNAEFNGSAVELKWIMPPDSRVLYFDVERTGDGPGWYLIGRVWAEPTGGVLFGYGFIDPMVENVDMLYYRLRLTATDGTTAYSPTVTVRVNSPVIGPVLYSPYPNPFNPSTTVHFTLSDTRNVTVAVYDQKGSEVARLFDNEKLNPGYHARQFNAAGLSSGRYFVRFTANGYSATENLILTK